MVGRVERRRPSVGLVRLSFTISRFAAPGWLAATATETGREISETKKKYAQETNGVEEGEAKACNACSFLAKTCHQSIIILFILNRVVVLSLVLAFVSQVLTEPFRGIAPGLVENVSVLKRSIDDDNRR